MVKQFHRQWKFIQHFMEHPLNTRHKGRFLKRYLGWQFFSRAFSLPVVCPFVNDSYYLMRRDLTSATCSYYTGLYDLAPMAFVLHSLREDDLFVDVGANVGMYTILAGAVVGAYCLAYEPAPETFPILETNLALNHLKQRAEARQCALGAAPAKLRFTTGQGAENRVVAPDEAENVSVVEVPVERLDDQLTTAPPQVIKIDTEGFEWEVLQGMETLLRNQSLPLALILETFDTVDSATEQGGKIHKLLLDRGFTEYVYEPFRRELLPVEHGANEGNTLYMRQPDFFRERLRTAKRYAIKQCGIEI